MSNEGALATLNDDAVIEEIASGTLMKQIAERFNCSKVAVFKRLSKHPDYAQAIKFQAESLVERATDEAFNCTTDTVNIARVRVDAAHKWAAARYPEVWGNRPQVQVNIAMGLDQSSVGSISDLLSSLQCNNIPVLPNK